MNTPILNIQKRGRRAEVIIDTGRPLHNGKTYRAFAQVDCPNSFTAKLVAEGLRECVGEAIASARREAYQEGYQHGSQKTTPSQHFSRVL